MPSDSNNLIPQTFKGLFFTTSLANSLSSNILFIHGFGDSGKAYNEVFDSKLADLYNLYVVDMPGFGSSPHNLSVNTMKKQANLLTAAIQSFSQQPIVIVAHSIGALIGTWMCQLLGEQIKYYFNVEGNLTEADSYFSSKPLQYDTPNAFFEDFSQEVFAKAITEERYRRYYASLKWATPQAMVDWATSSQAFVKDNLCGKEFIQLDCAKVYIWGAQDTPMETQDFIKQYQIPNKHFTGVGHWHMHENAEMFYKYIQERLENL
ncbi:hypothetical protein BKI52_00135 [marine bacterium AO1-C]|nr:hypothetical protein BKI52_00135 [marine bacterium AO1-C]